MAVVLDSTLKPFLWWLSFSLGWMVLLGGMTVASAEPRILVGPSESDEQPEAVETISGLSYDQLKKLRELRKWLDARQKIRDERDLKAALSEPHGLSFFKNRELLAPLGQRAPSLPLQSKAQEAQSLKLPPLPTFEDSSPEGEGEMVPGEDALTSGDRRDTSGSSSSSKVTHITPPPLGHQKESVQMEYELSPERALGIED